MCTPTSTLAVGDFAVSDPASLADPGHPDYYKNTRHYRLNADVEDIYAQWDALVPPEQLAVLEAVVRDLLVDPPTTPRELEQQLCAIRKRNHLSFRKAQLLHAYRSLIGRGEAESSPVMLQLLVKKSSKSQSGVLVITVLPHSSQNECPQADAPPVTLRGCVAGAHVTVPEGGRHGAEILVRVRQR